MDYYKEYNRIRKNLLQQARRHGINVVNIPTARQLLLQTGKKKILKSQVTSISKQKQSLQTIVKTKPTSKTPAISVKTLRAPKSIRKKVTDTKPKSQKKPKTSKPKTSKTTPSQYDKSILEELKKHTTEITKVDNDGILIDKFNGTELGYAGFTPIEDVAEYMFETYYNTENGSLDLPVHYVEGVSELDSFISDLWDKLTRVQDDIAEGGHGASRYALETVSKLLTKFEKMKEEDWVKSYQMYQLMEEPIKRYIDEALYYIKEATEHGRSIGIIAKLLNMEEEDIENFDLSVLENSEYDVESVYSEYLDS